MRKLLLLGLFSTLLISCNKKKYKPYLGVYDCTVTEHLDSVGTTYSWDTTYTEQQELSEHNSKEMIFRDLTIPYKYIDNEGFYEASHLVPGLVWGRQITLTGDSINYYHHEAGTQFFWYIRYTGRLVN